MKLSCAAQNSAFKNHPSNILCGKKHLYGIVKVHIIHTTALNITKQLQVTRYRIFKKSLKLEFSLTDCLTDHSHKARGQMKQCMVTILRHNNKLTSGMCLFGVPTSVGSLCLVFSFIFNQVACFLHPTKPYQGVNFPYQHFLSAAYLDTMELFQSWISGALQSWRYYERYTC